ncbi:MAG TPA: N-6 DNA methylase [Longimicrobiales bacterium]
MRDLPPFSADALHAAADHAGVGRLASMLGYQLVEPPDGVPVDDDATRRCRHVASAGGIAVWALALDDVEGASARAARIRATLGSEVRPVLLFAPFGEALAVASGGLDGRPRMVVLSRAAPSATELETLLELRAGNDGSLAALARHAKALGRAALTRRFFREFRARRDIVARSWSGVPERARRERNELALLFLSRIVFLYFLQKQGHLLGRPDYLIGAVREAAAMGGPGSVFRRLLVPLFFGALNLPAELRAAEAKRLGPLPYLNGGLFEPHALERKHTALDLPDDVVIGVFDGFFERYRFTTREGECSSMAPLGIQPEMLGRMFEGLMAADQRGRTGTFYTPAAVAERIVERALHAWLAGREDMDWRSVALLLREPRPRYVDARMLEDVRRVRMIDPACGSGAFVLAALNAIARLRSKLGDDTSDDDIRRDLATAALHGIDVEADAALLCALRLWLALTPRAGDAPVRPLPNLDQRVRQGDALLDPLELAARGDATTEVWKAAALDAGVRRARNCLRAHVERYASRGAATREGARSRIARAEARLARRWVEACLRRLDGARRDLGARLRDPDLFGVRSSRAGLRAEIGRIRQARSELLALRRRLVDTRALPFFSMALHFGSDAAPGSFDLVVSNPPWVRSHRWSRTMAGLARARYRVCEGRPWYPGMATSRIAAGQVDLALLFVERGIDLLRRDGVLAMLIPSKSYRSLSAGAARALVTARTHVVAIEDHALRHRAIFRDADAFAGVLIARARTVSARAAEGVRVTLSHATGRTLRFTVPPRELPLDRLDPRSPWLIVPPDVRRALRAMQSCGTPIGADARLRIQRGAMTGANDALLFQRAERKLGDAVVAWRSGDGDDARRASHLLHVDDLCPVVRGAGIRPFRFETGGFVAWCHDDATAGPRPASRRLCRALAGERARLQARPGWRPGLPDGVLFRLDAAMLRPRVAWRDIATDLEVTPLPAHVCAIGTERPLVALNTVYFIAVEDEAVSFALASLLSALPYRVFARAVAERAKDARFRFFGWVVAALPLPPAWSDHAFLRELAVFGERAHAASGLDASLRAELDDLAARVLRLSARHMHALHDFDDWLSGRTHRQLARRLA